MPGKGNGGGATVYKGLYPPGAGYVYDKKKGGWVKAPKGVKGSSAPPKNVARPAKPGPGYKWVVRNGVGQWVAPSKPSTAASYPDAGDRAAAKPGGPQAPKKVQVRKQPPPPPGFLESPFKLPEPPTPAEKKQKRYKTAAANAKAREARLRAFLKEHGHELGPKDYAAYQNMYHSYEESRKAMERNAPPAVVYAGRPTAKDLARFGASAPAWGDVRYDPGGGYVIYADGPKDWRKSQLAAIRTQRAIENQPRLEPYTGEPEKLSASELRRREREADMDYWISRPDVKNWIDKNYAGRRRFEVALPYLPDIRDPLALSEDVVPFVLGPSMVEWSQGHKDFNWEVALDMALLPTLAIGAGVGTGAIRAGTSLIARPLKGSRAAIAGAFALRGGKSAAVAAAKHSFESPSYVVRGAKAGFRPVARGARAVTGKVAPLATARAANYQARKQAALGYYAAKAAYLNLAAWDRRRVQLLMDEAGQAKIDMFLNPVTGGARPLATRRGLERELGFVGEPAARAAIGRGLEDFMDRNRELVSKLSLGIIRDPVEEAGKRVGRRIQFGRQYSLRPAIELQHATKRLKGAADYTALRLVGENVMPTERMAFHIEQAAERPEETLFHEIQATLVGQASKWLERGADGNVRLRDDAPKRLHQMVHLLRNSSEARETILKQLGQLSDEVIKGRIDAPGAVIRGARWVENEVYLQEKLLSSPHRAVLREFIIGAGIPEAEVDAFLKAVADPAARAHAAMRKNMIERELEQELAKDVPDPARVDAIRRVLANADNWVDIHYNSFANLFYGQPEDMNVMTSVREMMDALGPPESIDADGIAREIIDSGMKLPDHLKEPAVLARRINQAYNYVLAGEELGGKDWYDRAAVSIERTTEYINEHPRIRSGKVAPVTEKQVAQIYAILSAQDNTVNNVTQVRKALTQWVEHGEVWAGRNPSLRSKEVQNVLMGNTWDGRKRSSFYMNIIEDIDPEEYARLLAEKGREPGEDPVTVDMWIARIFGEEQPGGNYDAFEAIFHRMAQHTGWRPKEVQAAAWVAVKDEGIEAMRTKALAEGKKIPGAYYQLKQAGAADAFEHGIAKNFNQLTLEGLTTSPRAGKAFTQLMGKQAGGTFRASLAPVEYKTGYMVAMGAHELKIPTRKMTDAAIQGWRDAHRATLKEPGVFLGLWRNDDDGYVYLDISRHFKDRDEALEYARQQGQLAVADMKAVAAGDMDNAFPTTGLTPQQADEVKVALRGPVSPLIPHAERVPEDLAKLEAERAQKDWDGLIQKVIKDQGWRNNQQSREAAEDWLADEGDKMYPGWEDIQARVRTTREATYPDWARFDSQEGDLQGINSAEFADFFSEAERGEHAPNWVPHWRFRSPEHQAFYDDLRRYAGGFDDHIETSIPDYRGVQVRKGVAIAKAFPGAKVLDLMGSTGAWVKALAKRGNPGVNLDANDEMAATFARTPVEGARFEGKAFQSGFEEDSGRVWEHYDPAERFDIVNESMGFQFISPDREAQVAEAKRLLRPGGVLFTDEKVVTPEWDANEAIKDAWKAQFYTESDIEKKKAAILGDNVVGMKANMVTDRELEETLGRHFAHVEPYWEQGNFKGYIASDDRSAIDRFLKEYDPNDRPTAEGGFQAGDVGNELRQGKTPRVPTVYSGDQGLTLGFIRPRGGMMFDFGLQPYAADISTAAHEWGHFLRFSNFRERDLKTLSDWAGFELKELPPHDFKSAEEQLAWMTSPAGQRWKAAEEKIARGFEVYILTGGGRGLPPKMVAALKPLAEHMEANYAVRGPQAKRAVYNIAGLKNPWDELPPQVRDVYDFFLTHEEIQGGQFRYQEGMVPAEPGQFYVPYRRGIPLSVRHPYRTAKAFIQFRRTLPGRRGAMGVGAIDPSLNHIYKADLLRHGNFDDSQIASASIQQLQKAANLQSIFEVRKALLATDREGNYILARAVPERTDDVAVKLNPRKNSDQRLAKLHEYLGQLERGEKVSLRDLQKQDEEMFELLSKESFGGRVEGEGLHPAGRDLGDLEVEINGELQNRPARDVAADIIDGVMEPVENIVWVPRRFLDNMGIFEVPRNIRSDQAIARGIGVTADMVNDYLKASLLYLNPHYYGMNLVGNAVMNLLHEGLFAPLNLSRAFWLSHQMGEETAFIDFLMGRGLMSVAELKSLDGLAAGNKISNALGHASGVIVDMIPRRMAFIHEARRAGFRDAEGIRELLNDPDALYLVVTKAKRAMVDFDELSPFERDVLRRYIFVYPWLKGATMYSLRFPKEHPIQTAALALAYERQQDLAEEKVGTRPTYLDLILPVGVAERYGEKYPLVWNMRQVFTFSTPFELAQNMERFVTGNPNGEALSEMLQPWYGNALTSITGWDPFRHQEVPRGLPTLLRSLSPLEAPGWQAVQRVMLTEEQRRANAEAGRLYPRNRLDDILALALGSVAWTPVNPETARERAQVGPKSAEQKLLDWSANVEKQTGNAPHPQMVAIQATKIRYGELYNDLDKEHTDYDLTKARLQVFIELNPDQAIHQETWVRQIDATPEKNLKKWNDWLEKQLGWPELNKYNAYVQKWEKANTEVRRGP